MNDHLVHVDDSPDGEPNIVVGWQRMMDPEETCFDPPMVSLFNDG